MESSGCPIFLSDWPIRPTLADVSMLSLKLKKQFNVQLKRVSVNLPCLHFSTFLFSPSSSHKSVFSLLPLNCSKLFAIEKKVSFTLIETKPVLLTYVWLKKITHESINHVIYKTSCLSKYLWAQTYFWQNYHVVQNEKIHMRMLSNSKKDKGWHGIVCEKLTFSWSLFRHFSHMWHCFPLLGWRGKGDTHAVIVQRGPGDRDGCTKGNLIALTRHPTRREAQTGDHAIQPSYLFSSIKYLDLNSNLGCDPRDRTHKIIFVSVNFFFDFKSLWLLC